MLFTENKATNSYTAVLGQTPKGEADALVRTGGESLTKFVPNINASKWNDECWLNINNKAVTVASEKQTFVDGKIDLIVGNDCHRYYITPDGHLEYEIIFSTQPKSEILLDLQSSKGFDFYYQPPLEEEENHPGVITDKFRPDDVIGSYAVYYNKQNNKYQTGKFGHFFRPWFRDVAGNFMWGTIFIDPSANIISIIGDEEWLRKAHYPITLGPTLGVNPAGGSSGSISGGYFNAWHSTVDATGGVTDLIHYFVRANAAEHFVMAIYNDSVDNNRPDAQLTIETGDMSAAAAGDISAAYVATLPANAKLWLAYAGSGTILCYYDAAAANTWCYAGAGTSHDLPASWASTGNTNGALRVSCYATYAPAAAGNPWYYYRQMM